MALKDKLRKLLHRKKKNIPEDIWIKCNSCGKTSYKNEVKERLMVCPECHYHFTLTPKDRMELLLDKDSFSELWTDLESVDPLGFNGNGSYKKKLAQAQQETGNKDAAVFGRAKVNGADLIFGVTDSRFMMGSMGSVVGEKVTRAFELATTESLPVVIISGSGGGARMQEGCLSLMQLAKTSAAIARFSEAGGLYISILTNPTMAGVMASFASLGDILIAEPRALIGFTGPRVIEQTIKQKLPKDFQTSEFLLEHGFIDIIVERANLRKEVTRLLDY
ncbi:acetyl-CoA carboxylase carboxyltransferase subunit beta, partial [Candidatus Peregrinibacteria bacterium]|nr:acetyl-CoA carboxylase carboxyltransferase subunit beta [Candidatus Peregrinibacteria bacterium]